MKVKLFLILFFATLLISNALSPNSWGGGKRKEIHPFDVYDHEMHNGLFEAFNFRCTTCHPNDDPYTRDTVRREGCHICHKNPKTETGAPQDCKLCHINGKFPKPDSHKASWLQKHQYYAKQNVEACYECHQNKMFCIDCHARRDTVQERVHSKGFRYFHSVQARANPKKCDSCHVVNFCTRCHSGGL